MPFIENTPESLLPRSDSKNPGTTCKGLTGTGRPCRRPLSKSARSSPASSPGASSPNIVAAGYCWQHSDQASPGATPQGLQNSTIKERTSVDTLVDRLGLLEVEQRKGHKQKRKSVQDKPIVAPEHPLQPPRHSRPKPRSNLALLCCISEADEERKPPRQARPHQGDGGRPKAAVPTRPQIIRDPSSETSNLLSLIPSSASPQTTALLLGELAKPVSENDNEGYIYMFWLTPESIPMEPPTRAASTLLAPPSRQPAGQRRTSDVLNTISGVTSTNKTILLKIGRAANVQRRLNQWTRQCGYDLSLIRYYPYHGSASSTSVNEVPRTPRKVPNAHKVERLIHIELGGRRTQETGKCSACGREHREWFEVEATKEGVKAVDKVVRRWVDWGERA